MTAPQDPRPVPKPAEPLTEQRIDFAYTVFWTKMVRNWEPTRRTQMAQRIDALVTSDDFINNAFSRKFEVEGLEDASLGQPAHSGASLLALKKVLSAFLS
jgi:hypothetical protein